MSEASYLVELREAAPPAPERLRELVMTLPAPEAASYHCRPRPALSAALGVCSPWAWRPLIGGIPALLRPARATPLQSGGSCSEARYARPHRPFLPRRSAALRQWRRTDAHREVAPAAPGCLDEPPRQRPLRRNPERGRARRGGSAGSSPAPTTRPALRRATHGSRSASPSRTSRRRSPASRSSGRSSRSTSRSPTSRAGSTGSTRASQPHAVPVTHEPSSASSAGAMPSSARAHTPRVSLQLTTAKPAAQHVAPSRFDRFWDTHRQHSG